MNDTSEMLMAVSFFGMIALSIRSLAQVWIKRLEVKQLASSVGFDRALDGGGIDQRLARIEAAVDAIAVEVERISEAQRFSARLAADREQRHIAPPQNMLEGRSITPH